jgi:hypothetical protein
MTLSFANAAPVLALLGCIQTRDAPNVPLAATELRWDRSPEPPLVVNTPPDLITIRWVPSGSNMPDVEGIAEQHCRVWKLHAEPVREETNGNTRAVEFACRAQFSR